MDFYLQELNKQLSLSILWEKADFEAAMDVFGGSGEYVQLVSIFPDVFLPIGCEGL